MPCLWAPPCFDLCACCRLRSVWDAAACTERVVLYGHRGYVLSVAWSGDGRRLASCSRDRTVR